MDSFRKIWTNHPREKAGPLSLFTFLWVWKIFKQDWKEKLTEQNIWAPYSRHGTSLLGDRLERTWDDLVAKGKPNLVVAIAKTFWREFLFVTIVHFVHQVTDISLRPYLVGRLIKLMGERSSDTESESELVYVAISLIFLSFTFSFCANHVLRSTGTLGMILRGAVVTLIYRKSLKKNQTSMNENSPGRIVNLVSNDVSRFEFMTLTINFIWSGPLQCVIAAVFLVNIIGWSAMAGMGIIGVVAVIQTYTAKLTSKYRRKIALRSDERIRLTDEVLGGIHVIKMFGWERIFAGLLKKARNAEMRYVKLANFLRGLYMTFNLSTTRIALFVTIVGYAVQGQSLSADQAFALVSYYGILSQSMTSIFVRGIGELAECLVSLKRLQDFLMATEVNDKIEKNTEEDGQPIISVEKVTSSWKPEYSNPTLKGLTFTVNKGEVVALIGTVGAGKTSVIDLLLQEMNVMAGTVSVRGVCSYASQQPWIFAGTVRDNILLGLPYDSIRYRRVVSACSLKRDFELFPAGDMTLVGERGAALSGGQKARINLARAIYKEADIYLLDDPLSAVDAHVAKDLFNSCIKTFLKDHTVILATHQIQFVDSVDQVIYLNGGEIKDMAPPSEFLAKNHDIMKTALETKAADGQEPDEPVEKTRKRTTSTGLERMDSMYGSRTSVTTLGGDEKVLNEEVEEESNKNIRKPARFPWFSYLRIGSAVLLFSAFIVFLLAAQTLASYADVFLATWTQKHGDPEDQFKSESLTIYGTVIGLLFVAALLRGIFFYVACYMSAKKVHSAMTHSILYTHLSFFHDNPSGVILNRFSRDLGSTDELLPKSILDTSQIFCQVGGAIVVTMIANAWLILPVSAFLIITMGARHFYMKTAVNVKRLENTSRGPVYTHLNTCLQGLTTIRAHGSQKYLKNAFDLHQDLNTSCFFTYLSLQQAYSFALDLLNSTYYAVVCLISVYLVQGVDGASMGLVLTQSLTITGLLQWGMRTSSDMVNLMTSAERLLEYADLPQEEKIENGLDPPPNWPTKGEIDVRNVTLTYSINKPPAINGLSIKIKAGEKVGIVGRTGAGKSSLTAALFRTAYLDGQIFIDGYDITQMRLDVVRPRLSIIPQDPILFSGTLRYNLDPFVNYPDATIWRALEEVDLSDVIGKTGRGLDTAISDGGSNLSVGQKQLVCLTRAVLKGSRVIILDEATASVDPETDGLIQRTIRTKFKDSTVLTIAHRLNTVIDSDRILVMDAGRMVEFDSPHRLLQKESGYFRGLVTETGPAMASQLAAQAQHHYQTKQFQLNYADD